MALYDFKVLTNKGEEVSLEQYKGKVLLIVNTATGCGFTPQYEGLQALYEKYQAQGFEVLDFPCNQFFHQAPGSDEEIQQFCTFKYHTTFPRFKKIEVNGDNEAPLYTYLKSQPKGGKGKKIKWNFEKFLINRDGEVVARFGSMTKPEKIDSQIAELLK